MIAKSSLVAIVLAFLAGVTSCADEPVKVKLGDTVMLELTGDLAKKYRNTPGSEVQSNGALNIPCVVLVKGIGVELMPIRSWHSSYSFEVELPKADSTTVPWRGKSPIKFGSRREDSRKRLEVFAAKGQSAFGE
ncbi:MAG: hypothetical protein U0930_22150 [Pirellulales bacterium]